MKSGVKGDWVESLFLPADPLPLGLFRIAFGVLLLFRFISLCLDFNPLFTEAGPVPLQAAEAYGEAVSGGVAPYYRWSLFAISESTAWARLLFAVYGVAIVACLLGWRTRLTSLIVFVLTVSIHRREPILWLGGDSVIQGFAFWMLFVPAGHVLALDACRFTKQGRARPVVRRWALLLMQAQMALIYLATLLLKLEDPSWIDGTALGHSWQLPFYSREWIAPLAGVPALVMAGTGATLLFEAGFPILVWWPRFRLWLLSLAALFHLGIELTLRTGIFSWAMLVCLIPFLPAANLRHWIERLDERARLRPGRWLWRIRMLQKKRWVVYFDGQCSFCRRWIGKARWAALPLVEWRDFRRHGDEVAHLNPQFDRAAYLIMDNTIALPGFLAFRSLLWAMPILWPLLPIAALPGSRLVGEWMYRHISIRYGPVRPPEPPISGG